MIRAELDVIHRWLVGCDPPILDVGSSTLSFRQRAKLPYDLSQLLGMRVVSFDAKNEPGVDIVGDAELLSDCVSHDWGGVVCTNPLEHTLRPWLVVREIGHVLRPGGRCVITAPWRYPDHPDAQDNYRLSVDALRIMARDASLAEISSGTLAECDARISYWIGEKSKP